MKAYYEKEIHCLEDSIDDYLCVMHYERQQTRIKRRKRSEKQSRIYKVSTRRCVDVKNR